MRPDGRHGPVRTAARSRRRGRRASPWSWSPAGRPGGCTRWSRRPGTAASRCAPTAPWCTTCTPRRSSTGSCWSRTPHVEVVRRLLARMPDAVFAVERHESYAHEAAVPHALAGRRRGDGAHRRRAARRAGRQAPRTGRVEHGRPHARRRPRGAGRPRVGDPLQPARLPARGECRRGHQGLDPGPARGAPGCPPPRCWLSATSPTTCRCSAWAGFGYAMADAHDEVLAAVPRRADVDEDGVAPVLEQLLRHRHPPLPAEGRACGLEVRSAAAALCRLLLGRLPRAARHPADAGRQRPAPHLLQLRPRRHLLGEQRRLDAVEQPLQPADELGLRDPQLGLATGRVSRRTAARAAPAPRPARARGPVRAP